MLKNVGSLGGDSEYALGPTGLGLYPSPTTSQAATVSELVNLAEPQLSLLKDGATAISLFICWWH